jgi:hypothetical protein
LGGCCDKRSGGPKGLTVEGIMATIRIAIAAALMLCVLVPVSAAQALECKHTSAQYSDALRVLESEAAQARSKAEANPLYIADVAYYDSVLRDARQCVKTLGPMTTASR